MLATALLLVGAFMPNLVQRFPGGVDLPNLDTKNYEWVKVRQRDGFGKETEVIVVTGIPKDLNFQPIYIPGTKIVRNEPPPRRPVSIRKIYPKDADYALWKKRLELRFDEPPAKP